MTAGETVYIRAGTYPERVIPQNSGSDSDHYITYAAYPGETVTLDGSGLSVPTDEGLFFVNGQHYLRLSGLRIINSAYAGILVDHSSYISLEQNSTYNTASSGIGVWGSDHITIDGNEVELACSNGMQESLTVAGTDTFEVKNNHVHNGPAGYNKEGICVKDGASNGKVYQNRVDHTRAVGIYVDAWDKHTFNIDVFQNVVHDVSAMGIALASEQGGQLEHIRVYNNIAYHNQLVGLWVSGCCSPPASHPITDIQIINNTFYNNGWEPWGGGIALDNNPAIQAVTIRNNLCSQNLSFQIAVDAAVPTQTLTVDHNLIDGYRGGEGEIYGEDHVEGDPLLANPSGADFHLQPTSPAIDTGSAVDAPADDFDRHLRPLDGNTDGAAAFDIGAYEFSPWRVYLPIVAKDH
ncbi:MAG TPA: right-handed parallel beta-helix repeat-containing protein [Anaerolineae bacterium]